jgi:hypothetical protein
MRFLQVSESGLGVRSRRSNMRFLQVSESGLGVRSRRSASVLDADNKSDYWFDMFRPFWDESSLGFFEQEIILIFHFPTSDMVLPIRPNIYSQILESQNLVCSNQECRKHRRKPYGQSAAPKVLSC